MGNGEDQELTPAEKHEVERHKYFLSLERGYDVGFESALHDWQCRYGEAWRKRRQAHMSALQCDEIMRYKWIESEKAQRDLGREAALDWVKRYAAAWREWYEREYAVAPDEI